MVEITKILTGNKGDVLEGDSIAIPLGENILKNGSLPLTAFRDYNLKVEKGTNGSYYIIGERK